MYNLDVHVLGRIQSYLVGYYKTDKSDVLRSEINTKAALKMFDDIAEEKSKEMTAYDKLQIVEYLHRNLVKQNKLKYNNGFYKAIIN